MRTNAITTGVRSSDKTKLPAKPAALFLPMKPIATANKTYARTISGGTFINNKA